MSPFLQSFIGLILAATSVSISAQILMEMKILRSRVGISVLGAAVFDDVLVGMRNVLVCKKGPSKRSFWTAPFVQID